MSGPVPVLKIQKRGTVITSLSTGKREKEFLYVGHYIDTKGRFILKIGTTNDLERRAQEHTRNYHKAREFTLPPDSKFAYDWHLRLSKYNTLRYEDLNRELLQNSGIGRFIRNDRFLCEINPEVIVIQIKKTYFVHLGGE